jgi:hypothetical protein
VRNASRSIIENGAATEALKKNTAGRNKVANWAISSPGINSCTMKVKSRRMMEIG